MKTRFFAKFDCFPPGSAPVRLPVLALFPRRRVQRQAQQQVRVQRGGLQCPVLQDRQVHLPDWRYCLATIRPLLQHNCSQICNFLNHRFRRFCVLTASRLWRLRSEGVPILLQLTRGKGENRFKKLSIMVSFSNPCITLSKNHEGWWDREF